MFPHLAFELGGFALALPIIRARPRHAGFAAAIDPEWRSDRGVPLLRRPGQLLDRARQRARDDHRRTAAPKHRDQPDLRVVFLIASAGP